jgi:hypothetical protein
MLFIDNSSILKTEGGLRPRRIHRISATLRTVFENNRRGTLNPEENVVSDTPPPPKLRFPCRY